MATARLTLTTAIPVPNVKFFDCVQKVVDDPDATHPEIGGNPTGELTVTFEIRQQGNVLVSTLQCRIVNTQAEGLRAKSAPTGPADWAEVFSTTSGVATAYTSCKASFGSGGRAGLVTQMQTLGLLPAGVIS